MSQQTSTPVKVSASAANNTPATLDPDLRSQINTLLLRDGHVAKIQEALLHALNSNSSNWPTQVQSHALSLLRSGEITNYPALLQHVINDVREASSPGAGKGKKLANGDFAKKVNGSEKPNLAIPDAVIEEALRVTKESLEAVCEMDDHGAR